MPTVTGETPELRDIAVAIQACIAALYSSWFDMHEIPIEYSVEFGNDGDGCRMRVWGSLPYNSPYVDIMRAKTALLADWVYGDNGPEGRIKAAIELNYDCLYFGCHSLGFNLVAGMPGPGPRRVMSITLINATPARRQRLLDACLEVLKKEQEAAC